LDYVKQYLPDPHNRGFTGIKYYRVTGGSGEKQVYDRQAAVRAADEHAGNFLNARISQIQRAASILDRPPIVISPYDANCSAIGGMKVRSFWITLCASLL